MDPHWRASVFGDELMISFVGRGLKSPLSSITLGFFKDIGYNVDFSVAKSFTGPRSLRFEVRLDAFNALNHTQFTGVNATANFASLTDRTITNLPYDATGNLVNPNGFGTINGVAPPRTLQLVTRVTF